MFVSFQHLQISRSLYQQSVKPAKRSGPLKSKMAANFNEVTKSGSDSSINDSDFEAKNAAAARDSSPFSQLPEELIETILRNLDFISLANARLVSRRWNESVGKLRLCLRIEAPYYSIFYPRTVKVDFTVLGRLGDWQKEAPADAVKRIDGRALKDVIRQLPMHLMERTFEVVLILHDRSLRGILDELCAKLNHRCKLRLSAKNQSLGHITNNPQPGARIVDLFPNLSLDSLAFEYFTNLPNLVQVEPVADFLRTSGKVQLTLRGFGKRGDQLEAFCDRFPGTTFLSLDFALQGVVAQNWNALARFSRLVRLEIDGHGNDKMAIPAFAKGVRLPALKEFACHHLPPNSNFFNAMPQLKQLTIGSCLAFCAEPTHSDINEVISALANGALKNLRTATLNYTGIPPESSLAYLKRLWEAICRHTSLCPKFKLLQWSGTGLILSEADHLGSHLASLPASFLSPLPFTLELCDRQSAHRKPVVNLLATSLATLAQQVQRTGLKQLKFSTELNYAMEQWSEIAADINSRGSSSAAVKEVGLSEQNSESDAEPILRIISHHRSQGTPIATEVELLIFRSGPADASAVAKTE